MHSVIIAIGTNVGDRKANIEKAKNLMEQKGLHIVKSARLYRTAPYGYIDQPDFLNTAVEVETILSTEELLKLLLSIEKEMGRVRKIHWGPRIIDLDIIFFDDAVINSENLKVPHPDMQNRVFVLRPLMDIAPERVHPVLHKTVKALYEELKNAKKGA